MKRIVFIIFILSQITVFSQNNVLQIFDNYKYSPIDWSDIKEIRYNDIQNDLIIIREDYNSTIISLSDSIIFQSGKTIPLIEIFTDEYLEEINSKTEYKKGHLRLNGFGEYLDEETDIEIRGRGNSSWTFEKKPYRLKFSKKISLCGLPPAKNFVLLANYMDCSLLQNVLAFKIGKILNLPYTNNAVPVDINFNGIYKGSYLLTNKPGINAGSVEIDENNSVMWELDTNYDESLKFMSPRLNLPVMVSDPDINDEEFEYWKNDFIEMERAVCQNKASNYIDMEIAAKYLLVYEIMKNDEIGFPKSVKLFKTKGNKYIFGPIWDFDVAMGKIWLGECYTTEKINNKVWKNALFGYLENDSTFQETLKENLMLIKYQLPELLTFIDDYSSKIRPSAIRNQKLYSDYEDFDQSIEKLKEWLILRFESLSSLYLNY